MRRIAVVLMVLLTGCGSGQLASTEVDVATLPDPDPVPTTADEDHGGHDDPGDEAHEDDVHGDEANDAASGLEMEVARDVGPLDGVALAQSGAEALAATSFEMVAEAWVAGEGQAFSMSAAFAEDGETGRLRLDVLGEAIEMRFLGDTVYMTSNFLAFMFPVDTPWIGIADAEQSADSGFETETFSADEFLAMLQIVDSDAEIVGTEEIDGVTTTHVRGEVSVDDLVDAGIDSMMAEFDMTGGSTIDVDSFTIDVWVGDDGIPRRVVLAAADVFEFSMDIRSVGEPVEVAAPPADEVTWMEDLLGDFGFAPA